jgi:hypothetical protein
MDLIPGLGSVDKLTKGSTDAMGGITFGISATAILAAVALAYHVTNQKKPDKSKQNIVTGTLAASLGIGALTMFSCLAFIGETSKFKGRHQRQQLQQQVGRLRGSGRSMGRSFGDLQ